MQCSRGKPASSDNVESCGILQRLIYFVAVTRTERRQCMFPMAWGSLCQYATNSRRKNEGKMATQWYSKLEYNKK